MHGLGVMASKRDKSRRCYSISYTKLKSFSLEKHYPAESLKAFLGGIFFALLLESAGNTLLLLI